MTGTAIQWFAAAAVLIGAVASIFRPDNKLCPVNLTPAVRGALVLVLGALAAGCQSMVGGATWQEAVSTMVAACLAGWTWHGLAPSEKPTPENGGGK